MLSCLFFQVQLRFQDLMKLFYTASSKGQPVNKPKAAPDWSRTSPHRRPPSERLVWIGLLRHLSYRVIKSTNGGFISSRVWSTAVLQPSESLHQCKIERLQSWVIVVQHLEMLNPDFGSVEQLHELIKLMFIYIFIQNPKSESAIFF